MEAVTGHYLTLTLDKAEADKLTVLLLWLHSNASNPNVRMDAQSFLDVLVW